MLFFEYGPYTPLLPYWYPIRCYIKFDTVKSMTERVDKGIVFQQARDAASLVNTFH